MQKVDFYLTPFNNKDLSDIEVFEKNIKNYCDLLDYVVNKKDDLVIPSQFYETHILDNISVCDYLFSCEFASDSRELLFAHLRELQVSPIPYDELFLSLESINHKQYIALLGMFNNIYISENRLYIKNKEMWLSPHRFYLLNSQELEDFLNNMEGCFPNLIFHERILNTIRVFNNIQEHIEELVRHLRFLNDHAKDIYDEIGLTSSELYDRFESEFGVISSGRGSNEGLDKYKCKFLNDNNEYEDVRCNPHTKMYTAYSDYRIYFNWGRQSIRGGKILVGHIGKHWT